MTLIHPAPSELGDGFTASTPGPAWNPAGPTTLRVLSWNVADMLGDPHRIRHVIRAADADVVCLQETHRWGGSRNLIAGLARDTGLTFVVGGRLSAGLAILVGMRAAVTEAQAVPLSRAPRRWSRVPSDLVPRPRGLARARVGLPGTQAISIVSAHLPLLPTERAKQWDHLRYWPDGSTTQVIAGDFNDRPGDPTWTALSQFCRDPAPGSYVTYPSRSPHSRLDAVLVAPSFVVSQYGWPQGSSEQDTYRGSDHRPVCADIELV